MEIVKIKTSLLEANTGQVWGLPSNPRQWTKDELRRLAASLLETPELFEARPCLVYPHEGKYIVLGGNFRLAASKENKAKEVPCIVFPADTPVDKLKEIVIKDNGTFGSWDFDALANEWDDLPLADWGAPAWDGDVAVKDEGYGEEFSIPDGERAPFQQMTFTLSDEQVAIVKDALAEAKTLEAYKAAINYGNENGNANALTFIIEQWIASRK